MKKILLVIALLFIALMTVSCEQDNLEGYTVVIPCEFSAYDAQDFIRFDTNEADFINYREVSSSSPHYFVADSYKVKFASTNISSYSGSEMWYTVTIDFTINYFDTSRNSNVSANYTLTINSDGSGNSSGEKNVSLGTNCKNPFISNYSFKVDGSYTSVTRY